MSGSSIQKHPSAPQVDPAIIAALMDLPVALLSDNMHRNTGSVGLTPYHKPHHMVGTAVTVKTRGDDNLAILRAFEFCRPGDVMVIDADGGLKNAVVGGILSFYGATIGLNGMVIDGSIRDVAVPLPPQQQQQAQAQAQDPPRQQPPPEPVGKPWFYGPLSREVFFVFFGFWFFLFQWGFVLTRVVNLS